MKSWESETRCSTSYETIVDIWKSYGTIMDIPRAGASLTRRLWTNPSENFHGVDLLTWFPRCLHASDQRGHDLFAFVPAAGTSRATAARREFNRLSLRPRELTFKLLEQFKSCNGELEIGDELNRRYLFAER